MKRINRYHAGKVLYMPFEEYETLVLKLTKGLYQPEINSGLGYFHTDKAEEKGVYFNGNINEVISKYFDIEVTSIHSDDNEEVTGIWIGYR